jgi:hypothetical protein
MSEYLVVYFFISGAPVGWCLGGWFGRCAVGLGTSVFCSEVFLKKNRRQWDMEFVEGFVCCLLGIYTEIVELFTENI